MVPALILSSDSHVFEPPDLWTSRIDAAFRDRAPACSASTAPTRSWSRRTRSSPASASSPTPALGSRRPRPFPDRGRFEDVPRGGYDPEQHLADMRLDGVAGEVLYPSQGLFYFRVADTPLMSAIFRAYNDWLAGVLSPRSARGSRASR